jgi:hypothetical protein
MDQKEKQTVHPWINAFFVMVGLGIIAFWGGSFFAQSQAGNASSVKELSSKKAAGTDIEQSGDVLVQTDAQNSGVLKSENYVLQQVSVGGDVSITSSSEQEAGPLQISEIRGESFIEKGKKDVSMLITWKTTKLTAATIQYGKNGTDAIKTFTGDGFAANHSVVLSGLDQSTTYIYTITAKDRSGNKITSDSYAVYTGAKNASLFDLISGAVTDTFGWAMQK